MQVQQPHRSRDLALLVEAGLLLLPPHLQQALLLRMLQQAVPQQPLHPSSPTSCWAPRKPRSRKQCWTR